MGFLRETGACLCRALAASIRVILFVGCLLLVLGQAANVVMNFNLPDDQPLSNIVPKVTFFNHMLSIGMLFVGVVGCYGAYQNHSPSYKVFAFAMALSIVLMIFYFKEDLSFDSQRARLDETTQSLSSKQQDYDWFHTSPQENQATKEWDRVQGGLLCCGIEGPQDWNSFRPKRALADAYPKTCCRKENVLEGLCKERHVFMEGCHGRFQTIQSIVWMAAMISIIYQFVLLLVSLFCLCQCCRSKTMGSAHRSGDFSLQISS